MGWLLLGWLLLIFSLNKTEQPEQPLLFTYWLLRHPTFLIHPLSQHSKLGRLWLPTPHCAALV